MDQQQERVLTSTSHSEVSEYFFNVCVCLSLSSSGRFLSILLKIEEMLHSWFPHVKTRLMQSDSDDDDGSPAKKQKVNVWEVPQHAHKERFKVVWLLID